MNESQQPSQLNRHLRAVLCLGIIALPLAAMFGCGGPARGPAAAQGPAGPTRVETTFVTKQNLTQTIEMSGTIEGDETVDLYAKVGGFLEEISVDIGDRVEAGQVLARLSIPEMANELDHQQASVKSVQATVQQMEAGIRQAKARIAGAEAALVEAQTQRGEKEAQLKLRRAEFERTKELVDSGSFLAKKLDEARFNLEASEAAIESVAARIRSAEAELVAVQADAEKAQFDSASAESLVTVAIAELEKTNTMLDYATIRAPFAGLVTKRMVDPGAFIQPAQGNSGAKPLLTVSRTSVVRLRLDLPMDEVQWLDRGDRAIFDRINALPGETFEGTVTRYSSTLDPTSRTMRVEIDLPNADHRLSPGYYGYVTLLLNEFEDVPTVPSSAVMTDEEGLFVYVLDGNICKRRAITTSFADGAIVGIASGLTGGETVVRSGGGQLSDGQQVATANSAD